MEHSVDREVYWYEIKIDGQLQIVWAEKCQIDHTFYNFYKLVNNVFEIHLLASVSFLHSLSFNI